MTALNFPNSPALGEAYYKYRWDGEKWVPGHTVVPFTPPQLTGLIGWWDASVLASMTFSGTTVLTMADQSGAGNHLGQSGSRARPTYSDIGLNNRPTLAFTPDQLLSSATGTFNLGTGNTLTLFFIGTMRSNASTYGRTFSYGIGAGADTGSANVFCMNRAAGANEITFTRNSAETTHAPMTLGTIYRIIVTVASSGATIIYRNGVATGTGTIAGNWASGGTLRIGGSTNTFGDYWSGNIAEMGISTAYSDAAMVAQLDAYLATKWTSPGAAEFLARTSGLDATHTTAYTNLINGLITDGIWDKLDILRIYATQNSTTALLNLKSTAYTGVINGSPTFTADRGFTGVNSSTTTYINSQFNGTTAPSAKFIAGGAHMSTWGLVNTAYDPPSGWSDGSVPCIVWPKYSGDNNAYIRLLGHPSFGGDQGVLSDVRGLCLGVNNAGNQTLYFNGSAFGPGFGFGANAVQNYNFYELGTNNAGTAGGCGQQQAMFSVGGLLTAGEVANFYSRLRTYMTAVGVP